MFTFFLFKDFFSCTHTFMHMDGKCIYLSLNHDEQSSFHILNLNGIHVRKTFEHLLNYYVSFNYVENAWYSLKKTIENERFVVYQKKTAKGA